VTLILKNILQYEHQLSDSDTEKYPSVRRASTLVTLILKNILQYDEHQLSDSDTVRHFQQYFSYMVAVSFIGGGNQSTQKKITDLLQVTDKLYHIMLYRASGQYSRLRTYN
jgi:hypothetical protein